MGASFFVSPTFSWIMAAVCGVLAVLFFMGRGKRLLRSFSSSQQQQYQKKRTPEQEKAYMRAIGIFMLVLAINEALLALFGQTVSWIPLLGIAIVVIGLVVMAIYIKKIS